MDSVRPRGTYGYPSLSPQLKKMLLKAGGWVFRRKYYPAVFTTQATGRRQKGKVSGNQREMNESILGGEKWPKSCTDAEELNSCSPCVQLL